MSLPHLGSWCFVDLLTPDGRMQRLAVIHPDPARQTLARRLETDWPPQRDDPFGVPRAVRTRRSELVSEVSDEMLVQAAHNDDNLAILRELGIGSMMVVPLIARGEVLGAITYVAETGGFTDADLDLAEDLAARCAVAIDNSRLYQAVQRARDEAEHASRAKSEFLATMSHEIRTPINAVIGYVDLLEARIAGPLTKDQARYLDRIRVGSRHLLGLINDVLDFSRMEANRLQLQSEKVQVGPVVDAALDLIRPQTINRTLDLPDACEGSRGAWFMGDVDRVRQIMVNLLSNAIKFTPDGGRIRIVCVHSDEARGELEPGTGPWTLIRVEDTGIGMEPAMMERLFEPFMQADTGYTRTQEGTGLGLSISRRLARQMGGDLTVESRPDEGSSFTLWLPSPQAAAPGATAEQAPDMVHPGDRVHGVSGIGTRVLRTIDEITERYIRGLREARAVPHIDELSDALLKDHTASLIVNFAQVLVLLEDGSAEAADLLRDGSAIQRTVADRHGLQRHRIGWSSDAIDVEFDILASEIERAVHEGVRENPRDDATRAIELLTGFVDQARQGCHRSFRMAKHGAALQQAGQLESAESG